MSKEVPTNDTYPTLPDLELTAKECFLITRKSRKFSGQSFLATLLSAVSTGLASLNQLAGELNERNASGMARQSLHQRFSEASSAFLVKIHNHLISQRYNPVANVLQATPIQRILIEDSSSQAMPKSNAEEFPASGNQLGATAGVKVDIAFDLLSGNVVSHTLQLATESDQTIGKEFVAEVKKGDLVLRDMGYFCLDEFTEIESRDAFWLSRLPHSVGVKLQNGSPLEGKLKKSRKTIDITVNVGAQGKVCRLVAVRATPEVASARKAEREKLARKSGKKADPKGLVRDQWHIMITNLDKQTAGVQQLTAIYRARWAVEIQFRGWKQSLNLTKALNRKSNKFHLEALVLAAMIAQQLGMKIAQRIGAIVGQARVSYEKLYDLLAVLLTKAKTLAEILQFTPDFRHITRDKRKRKSPIESGIEALN
jgi:hypothetical protein